MYDIAFLVIFTLAVITFLYRKRENLKRQGILYLYRTKLGIRLMDWTVSKFSRILKPMQIVVVASGYILLISMVWLLIRTAYIYITSPIIAQLIKAPPIAPLIPYFPAIFKLESFFPPLYFTYFLVALIIVAVSHEFAHGIFARLNKIKVKTTGFAFLGPILGAFVEPDEKQMQKAKKFPQLAILAAGTFANVIMAVIFGAILLGFFALSFSPAGVQFNSYATTAINPFEITEVSGIPIEDPKSLIYLDDPYVPGYLESEIVNVSIGEKTFLVQSKSLINALEKDIQSIIVYDDAPAVRAGIKGAIREINGVKIENPESLREELRKYSPGDEVIVTASDDGAVKTYKINLGNRDGNAYLGIGFVESNRGAITGFFMSQVEKVKNPFIHYEPNWDGDIAWFIYYLLWWITVINILVALFNMLPLSILDGGRFFYLTIWGITGSEKLGKKAFAFATWFIVFLLLAMMVKWVFIFF